MPLFPADGWDKIALRKASLLCCKHYLKGDVVSAQCNLIIDSCCDLPLELVQQEGVQLIDFNYIIDDKTFKDDFYQSITPKEFYDNIRTVLLQAPRRLHLPKRKPHSAMPSNRASPRYIFAFPAGFPAITARLMPFGVS